MAEKLSFRGRSRARRCAVQALYQHHLGGADSDTILAEFIADSNPLKKADKDYFAVLLRGAISLQGELNRYLIPHLDRPLEALDPVELSVLQLGSYELRHQQEVPWKVVINEAIELARVFGAERSHAYINGVLDKLARELRGEETAAAR